jgi:hypothetical protein
MTDLASFRGDIAVPLNHLNVALQTFDLFIHDFLVVE